MTPSIIVNRKAFILKHKIYFNETNAVGGVAYFSNFVKWQGMAREEYFIASVPCWKDIVGEIQNGRLNMITVEEHSHFIQHAFFGDRVIIHLQTTNIRRFSFDMVFFMTNQDTGNILYEGYQRLAFDNFKGKFVEIPQPMLESVKKYEIDPFDPQLIKMQKYFCQTQV